MTRHSFRLVFLQAGEVATTPFMLLLRPCLFSGRQLFRVSLIGPAILPHTAYSLLSAPLMKLPLLRVLLVLFDLLPPKKLRRPAL